MIARPWVSDILRTVTAVTFEVMLWVVSVAIFYDITFTAICIVGFIRVLHGAIPIALAASDFPFRLLVDAVTHVLSVFRVCKVP